MSESFREETTLSHEDRRRYARHLVLPSIGEQGQLRLKNARALVVGVGGLGSAISMYLAGAGVGHIGLVDHDTVDLSNLQRQVLHGTSTLGQRKTDSAGSRIHDLNPDIEIHMYPERFDESSSRRIATDYDVIVDGTDNFETRYEINSICLRLGIPYVYGAVFRLEGQVSVLCAPGGPCYRCLFPAPPPPGSVLTGREAGILGAIPGVIGTLQATETIKQIVGFGEPLTGRLLVFDGATMQFTEIVVDKNPACPACGEAPAPSS